MTRPVEIPEEAVEAAAQSFYGSLYGQGGAGGNGVMRDVAREAIAVALPYLAPAGDGGLREAQLRQEFRAEIMRGYQAALCNGGMPETGWTLGDEVAKVVDNLLASLAAQPAAPAQHEPIGVRPTDAGLFVRCACGQNPTPKYWIEDHWQGERAVGERLVRELLAAAPAVPQPADREALYQAISDAAERTGVDKFLEEEDIEAFTSASLAVLAGEQEQVEK